MAKITIEAGRPPDWFRGNKNHWGEFLAWWIERETHAPKPARLALYKRGWEPGSKDAACMDYDVTCILCEDDLRLSRNEWIAEAGCPLEDTHHYDNICDLCGWDGPAQRAEDAAQARGESDRVRREIAEDRADK